MMTVVTQYWKVGLKPNESVHKADSVLGQKRTFVRCRKSNTWRNLTNKSAYVLKEQLIVHSDGSVLRHSQSFIWGRTIGPYLEIKGTKLAPPSWRPSGHRGIVQSPKLVLSCCTKYNMTKIRDCHHVKNNYEDISTKKSVPVLFAKATIRHYVLVTTSKI